MNKRYQIFISSTYKDLVEERRAAMEAIIELDCFPAGMESFPASSQRQFDYISKIIDKSDYYIIIIAGKYGTLSDEGISFTEKEFDYAVEKGIPIISFVKRDISKLSTEFIELDHERRKKLEEFRTKVMDSRMVKMWDDYNELKAAILLSLPKEIDSNPQYGWIRGTEKLKPGEIILPEEAYNTVRLMFTVNDYSAKTVDTLKFVMLSFADMYSAQVKLSSSGFRFYFSKEPDMDMLIQMREKLNLLAEAYDIHNYSIG